MLFVLRAFVRALGLGLNNISSTDTYNNVGGISDNCTIDKNIRDLKTEFGIDNIPIENDRLPKMYRMPKMHKSWIHYIAS